MSSRLYTRLSAAEVRRQLIAQKGDRDTELPTNEKKAGRPHTGCVVKPPEDWLVLIQDHHPAYISWQQY